MHRRSAEEPKSNTARFSHTPNATAVAQLSLGAERIILSCMFFSGNQRDTDRVTIVHRKAKKVYEIACHHITQMRSGKK
jgi:hypothetical protein